MKRIAAITFLLALAAFPLAAQRIELALDHLEPKAEEVVEVTLEGPMLQMAGKFLSPSDPDEREVREMIRELRGIFVRSYTFASSGQYQAADLERIRRQIGSSWQKIVNVRSRKSDNVEIYMQPGAGRPNGLVIIAAEPKELTVVHIDGPFDLERIGDLSGNFGVPDLQVESRGKKGDRR